MRAHTPPPSNPCAAVCTADQYPTMECFGETVMYITVNNMKMGRRRRTYVIHYYPRDWITIGTILDFKPSDTISREYVCTVYYTS